MDFGKLLFLYGHTDSKSCPRKCCWISISRSAKRPFSTGCFCAGIPRKSLRRDISVPPVVLAKWHREAERQPELRDLFTRMIEYRRHVLAIFDTLVGTDGRPHRLQ